MENNEISAHEVRIYQTFLANPSGWMTNKEIADLSAVAGRTARMHTLRFVNLGIIDRAEVFPGHRYRLSGKADKRNRGYVTRLEKAAEVIGA